MELDRHDHLRQALVPFSEAYVGGRSDVQDETAARLQAFLSDQELKVWASTGLEAKEVYDRHYMRLDPRIDFRIPILEQRYHPEAGESDVLCLFLEHDGVLIGSTCTRRFELSGSLKSAFESLTMLYGEHPPEGMHCRCSASRAADIADVAIAFMAGGHVDRRWSATASARPCYDALQRVSRLAILDRWDVEFVIALSDIPITSKIGLRRYGHEGAYPRVTLDEHETRLFDCDLLVSPIGRIEKMFSSPRAADLGRPVLETLEAT